MSGAKASGCAFCRIVAGELHADVVYEDDLVLAFLDVKPVFIGHVLVIPKRHYECFDEAPPAALAVVFEASRRISVALREAVSAEGSFVATNNRISQSVPHLHVHVVPRKKKDGLRGFFWPRQSYTSDEHRREVAGRVRAAVGAVSLPASG